MLYLQCYKAIKREKVSLKLQMLNSLVLGTAIEQYFHFL